MVHLRMGVALLVVDCLLHEPDEVLLGLVECIHWGGHDDKVLGLIGDTR